MICRGYSSLDVAACAGGLHAQVPTIEELLITAQACAGLLERLNKDRPPGAALGGELCAQVVAEIDRQRGEAEKSDRSTSAAAAEA
jgi:hypothetical protein